MALRSMDAHSQETASSALCFLQETCLLWQCTPQLGLGTLQCDTFLWVKSPSHDLKPCTCSLFWISLGQLLVFRELLPAEEMRWTSGTGILQWVPWWRVTKWGPADSRTTAFWGELKEKYTYNFIGVFKGSEKAFQSQVQFVLNKSCLSSSIKSTCTVYSQYLYKVLPASKQTNHISTLPHRMHLNLMSEETKEKTRSKSSTSVKEK